MYLQIERIENHQARLSAEIEPAQFENAKRKAARKISRQVAIRGFRKGKAPYSRVARTVGEGTIIEEAIDDLTQTLYRQALFESKVSPYGPGSLEDVKLDPPTFIFTLPMQPVVDLRDFRGVRVDYEKPTIDESDVDDRLRQYQHHFTKLLDDEIEAAQLGHRLNINVDSQFLDDYEPVEVDGAEDEAEEAADSDDGGAPPAPKQGDVFVVEKDMDIVLDPSEEPFLNGFLENLVGAEAGADIVFELTIPEDDDDPALAGRLVEFVVTINNIEAVEIPELDDEFIRQVNELLNEEASDLESLRSILREELEDHARRLSEEAYSNQVMDTIIAGADLHYPEAAVEAQIDSQLDAFKARVTQQRMAYDDLLRISGNSETDLRAGFRDEAVRALEYSLVMNKLREELGADVKESDVDTRFENFVASFDRDIANEEQIQVMRGMMRQEMVLHHMNAKLVALGRGEDMDAAVEALRGEKAAELQQAKAKRDRQAESGGEGPGEAQAAADDEANANDDASES